MAINLFNSKKGMVFTILGIILAAFIIVYSEYDFYHFKEKSEIVQQRVISMDNFIDDIEKDIEREMFIGGYRSIIAIDKHLSENGSFLPDVDKTVEEVFLNGTINEEDAELMSNASFNEWALRINEEANKLNINVEFIPHKVLVTQESPWFVTLNLNVSYNITDNSNIASWYITKEFDKKISILGFEDPTYILGSNGLVTNIIFQSHYDPDYVNNDDNTTVNLTEHLRNSYYIASEEAPSFLMRFEGNFSSSPQGIESMVNVEDFMKQNLPNKTRSVIDYIYLDPAPPSYDLLCDVESMPAWFIIDDEHKNKYEINIINYTTC